MAGRKMDLPEEEIARRIEEGWSLERVCEHFDVSVKTLWNRGIRGRQHGGHNKGKKAPRPLTRCKHGHGRRIRDKKGVPYCPECRKACAKRWAERNPKSIKAARDRYSDNMGDCAAKGRARGPHTRATPRST